MKTTLSIVLVFTLMKFSFAQINLVPNYSFEEYSQCPDGENQVSYATGWENWFATPDYFNGCATNGFNNVPYSLGGFQNARTGIAYAGIFNYWPHFYWNPFPWVHDLIGIQLLHPLEVGEKYYFEMHVSLASWIYSPCASNNLGVKFTTQSFANYGNTFNGSPLVNNSAVISVESIVNDTADWVKVAGYFVADSAYQYLVVGNFFDDDHTDTAIIGSAPFCYSYYFIEDVCVSNDSSGCLVTGIQNLNFQESIRVSPNPFTEQCTIEIPSLNSNDIDLKLADLAGRLEEFNWSYSLQNKKVMLTIYNGNLEKGLYFLSITAGSNKAVIPLIIQ